MEPFGTDGAEPRKDPYKTGRCLVFFEDDSASQAHRLLDDLGLNVASTTDFRDGAYVPGAETGYDVLHLDRLNVAVLSDAASEQSARLSSQPGIHLEPERYVYARANGVGDGAPDFAAAESFVRPSPHYQGGPFQPYPHYQGGPFQPYPHYQGGPFQPYPHYQGGPFGSYPPYGGGPAPAAVVAYLEGFRDAAQCLLERLGGAAQAAAIDESQATWGLQAIRAAVSRYSGADIAVAVLDTGFDLEHPDFAGRTITHQSFIPGETTQDGHGHGTHTIGTACGPLEPEFLPRYGVAHKANIFAGKVLSNEGIGTDGQVLAGMNWAIANRCRVISMSLGTPTRRSEPFSRGFERVARRALDQGTLIVAAAGNESRRDMGITNPVSHPANCPSILAVAAVDQSLRVAYFSNQGARSGGGVIDISGPGIDVYSSFPMPTRYRVLDGTSMATPHVAGVAALFAELKPDASAADVKKLLLQTAMRIPGAVIDVGAGLVQSP